MARGRWLAPDFYDDFDMAQCSVWARLLYPALWQNSDRCGVFEWEEPKLKKYAFGYDDMSLSQFSGYLQELLHGGFIKTAIVDGKRYGFVPAMEAWQRYHKEEKERFRDVFEKAEWRSGGGGVAVAPPQSGGSSTPIALIPILESLTESLTDSLTETDLSAEHEKKSPVKRKRARTPSAPPAGADGYTELVGIWFDNYERYYKTKPAWGPVYGRQLKAILAKSNVEEMRRLIPAFFDWRRPEVIRGGHSLSTGYASLAMKLEELRADIAHPERRAFAAAVAGDEKQATHDAEGDAQQRRVLAKIAAERNNAIGSGEGGGNLGTNTNTVRGLQPPSVGLVTRGVGGLAPALVRPGADSDPEARLSPAPNAWPGGHPGDDDS